MNTFSSFDIEHSLDYADHLDKVPFDTYSLNAVFFAIEKDANTSVPIASFILGGISNNFIGAYQWSSTTSNFIDNSGTEPTTSVKVESALIWIKVKRSRLALGFTLCLFVINSALTVSSVYIALLVGAKKGKVEAAVLFLPVTIILTIPALRGLYVGSPPFGIFIGRLRYSDLSLRADEAPRYIWVLSADDDSCSVLCGTDARG